MYCTSHATSLAKLCSQGLYTDVCVHLEEEIELVVLLLSLSVAWLVLCACVYIIGMFSQQRKVPLVDPIQQLISSDFKKPNYVHRDYRNVFVCVQEKIVLLLIHGFQSACTILCDYHCLPNRGKPHLQTLWNP